MELSKSHSFLVPTFDSFSKLRTSILANGEKKYLLLDSSYDRKRNLVKLTFYDDEGGEVFHYYDKTHFKYHCYTNVSPEKLDIELIMNKMPGFHYRNVEVFDRIEFRKKKMLQILTETPLEIRSGKTAISKVLEKWPWRGKKNNPRVKVDGNTGDSYISRAWENNIKAHETYCYDYGYTPGMYYTFKDVELEFEGPETCPICGGEDCIATYGYDEDEIKAGTERVVLVNRVCVNCETVLWKNDNLKGKKWKPWKSFEKPNDLSYVGKEKIRVPIQVEVDVDPDIAAEIALAFRNESEYERREMESWIPIFFADIPNFKYVSMDIEVLGKKRDEFPNVDKAERPVCCVCFVGSDGKKRAYVLKYYYRCIPDGVGRNTERVKKYLKSKGVPVSGVTRDDFEEIDGKWFYVNRGQKDIFSEFPRLPRDTKIVEFDEEVDLLYAVFKTIEEYPFLVTYNGDNFDLRYLYNRSIELGIKKDEIPFWLKKERSEKGIYYSSIIHNGMHLDLYHWFSNRSIKGYVYGSTYVRDTLDEVGEGVVGYKKVHHEIVDDNGEEKWLPHYSRNEMVYYCFIDTQLTFDLLHFGSPGKRTENLVFYLLLLLMRISNLGFYAVLHRQISNWIRSMFYSYHRTNNYLIPQAGALRHLTKGRSRSIIEGKGFEGAYVPPTKPGIWFNCVCLDFASLYPSIIKQYNLSYETVDVCVHEVSKKYYTDNTGATNVVKDVYYWEDERTGKKIKNVKYFACKRGHEKCLHEGRIPGDVPHYVCKQRGMGIMSLLSGLIRDFRVFFFKRKASEKDENGNLTPLAIYSNVVQSMLKVFINGSYGVFGSKIFAFYQIGVPESTTAIGRFSTKSVIDYAKENFENVTVIGGDTDSGFFHDITDEQIEKLIEYSSSELKMDLDVEYKARFMAFSHRKKNYLVFKQGGGITMKGVSGKKRNTPDYMQTLFKEIVDDLNREVQTEDDLESAVEKMRLKLVNEYKKLRDNRIPPRKLAVTMQLKQDPFSGYASSNPQHVKVAKIIHSVTKKKLHAGDYVTFVKTKTKDGCMPIELVSSPKMINVKTYLNTLGTVFSQLIDCFGLDWKQDIVNGDVKKMDAYFRT